MVRSPLLIRLSGLRHLVCLALSPFVCLYVTPSLGGCVFPVLGVGFLLTAGATLSYCLCERPGIASFGLFFSLYALILVVVSVLLDNKFNSIQYL